jgi:acetoin utilization protein AcuB
MNITDITVEEFTSPSVITIQSSANLDRAQELMQEHGIRHLPVVEKTKVLGVISERDLCTHAGKNWEKMLQVSDIMITDILSVYANDNLGEVAFQLSDQKKGSAIVLDSDGNLYGIFTTTDALNALVEIVYPVGKSEFRETLV